MARDNVVVDKEFAKAYWVAIHNKVDDQLRVVLGPYSKKGTAKNLAVKMNKSPRGRLSNSEQYVVVELSGALSIVDNE